MKKLIVEVPEELAVECAQQWDRLAENILLGLHQVKIREALLLVERSVASLGRTAELAGISTEAMIQQARAAGVQPRWSEEMTEDELA